MKKKTSPSKTSENIPVSKQTAGGVAGAIVGGVVGGPVGAVAGAIAGTILGNRSARGEALVSATAVTKTKKAVQAVKKKLPSVPRITKKSAAKSPKLVSGKSSPKKRESLSALQRKTKSQVASRTSKSAKVAGSKKPQRKNENKARKR